MDESRARALLRAERAEVAELLHEAEKGEDTERDSATGRDTAAGTGDYGDAATLLTEQAEDEAIVADLQERVAAIDRALARLEAGTYGRSVLSGQPIPDERLEADPAAELTVDEARAQR